MKVAVKLLAGQIKCVHSDWLSSVAAIVSVSSLVATLINPIFSPTESFGSVVPIYRCDPKGID